jgi:cysteine desulfurase/selenocysteine lyase
MEALYYFNNAATSFPKPPEVIQAITRQLEQGGFSPSRGSGTYVQETEDLIFECRKSLANLVGAPDPAGVCFGLNASDGLNQVIHGLLLTGDHVITTEFEHNSVLRPLEHLKAEGIDVDHVRCSKEGTFTLDDLQPLLNPNTRLIILNHVSNVTGTITPLKEVGELCRERGIMFLVDGSQSVGAVPINMRRERIDALAFTGHKALLGPTGTGGVIFNTETDFWQEVRTIRQGGTGTNSAVLTQPPTLPTKFEVGTPNVVGIAGLKAGLEFVKKKTVQAIREHEMDLTNKLQAELHNVPGLTLHGLQDATRQTAVVSVTSSLMTPADLAIILAEKYNIITREGLHCAPLAHKRMGTFPAGTLRFSMGVFNTAEQVKYVGDSLRDIMREWTPQQDKKEVK